MTLVSLACSSALVDGIVDQINYLVVTKNADCTIADANNMNAVSVIIAAAVDGLILLIISIIF